jgi:hypothetical protein
VLKTEKSINKRNIIPKTIAFEGRDFKLISWFFIANTICPSNQHDVKSNSNILGVLNGSAYCVLKYKFIRTILVIKKEIELEYLSFVWKFLFLTIYLSYINKVRLALILREPGALLTQMK